MATVTLKNGKSGTIPDGLSDADAAGAISRLNNAIDSDNQASQPASGGSFWSVFGPGAGNSTPAQLVGAADTATGGRLSEAASWLNQKSGGTLAPTANMAGNVAANVVALPWDAAATITNALTKTARNYGVFADRPYIEYPTIAPQIKQAFGIAPNTGPVSSRIENALTIASTGGEGIIPRLFGGAIKEGLAEGGSLAGQKIAENTDPRLSPLLETAGAVGANAMPYEQGASTLATIIRRRSAGGPGGPGGPGGGGGGTDPGAAFDAAVQMQNDLGLSKPPITLGQVGSPVVQQFEKILGAIPFLGAGVQSAREQAKGAIVDTRNEAAANVGATPTDTTPTAPGTAAFFGAKDYLNDVSQRMENIENNIAGNTQGPGGGAALIDVHPLLDSLQNMKTMTDAAGNVRSNVAPVIGSMINDEIGRINAAREPEDPRLHTQLVNDIQGLQSTISAPNTPPQDIPGLQAQLAQKAAQMDANLKVPFNVLRQMKTLNSYEVNADGDPTLNGHMGGKVLDAYRDTIQRHVNGLSPQLGTDYQSLNDEYKAASDASRALKGLNEQTTTSMLKRGTAAPSTVQPIAATPVWGEAAGNTIRQMGNNTKGEFVPREFAASWNNMTPAAKALYTQTNPDAARMLNNAGKLAANFDIPPETGGLSKALAMLELFNRGLEHIGLGGTLLGAPGSYIAESAPVVRAVAGRPQPYFQSLRENIPALLAVARNQQQSQGQ